jgi:hypothetical protein
LVYAHVAGVPIEETVLALMPIWLVLSFAMTGRVRAATRRLRRLLPRGRRVILSFLEAAGLRE